MNDRKIEDVFLKSQKEGCVIVGPIGVGKTISQLVRESLEKPVIINDENPTTTSLDFGKVCSCDEYKFIDDIINKNEKKVERIQEIFNNTSLMRSPHINRSINRDIYYKEETTIMDYPKKSKKNKFKKSRRK